MKNIVFTSYSGTPEFNQPETWLKRIRGYTGILQQLGKTHHVTGIERIDFQGKYEQGGVNYLFIRLNKRVARFPFRMHRVITRLKPDVVFVNGFIFPLQIIQLKWQLERDVKIIVLHRAERPFKGIKKYFQKIADRCISHYLFTSSEFGEEWIQEGIIRDRKKIREIIQASSVFTPIDREIASRSVSVNGEPVFLWVGRLDANKDPLTVVKAFIDFLSYHPAATLYMIYQTEEMLPAISDLIAMDENVLKAIRLVGAVPHEEMLNWYNCADFILSGSHYEGSGVAVSEAMSCGCIPVVTNISSFRRMTGPGKCGLLFEPGNHRSLLEALVKTKEMNMEEERNKTILQFEKELSFGAIAGKIEELINEKETGQI